MKTYILLLSFLAFGNAILDQSFDEKFESQDVQIHISMTLNGFSSGFSAKIAFNKDGQLTLLHNSTLAFDDDHYAAYSYQNDGNVAQEVLFQIDNREEQIVRRTHYQYRGDSVLVTVVNADGAKKAEFIEIKSTEYTKERWCLMDKLNQKNTSEIHNSRTIFNYDNGKLESYDLTSMETDYEIRLEIKPSKKAEHVVYRTIRDTIDYSFFNYRFYDKKGRLTHLGGDKSKRKWSKRFIYDNHDILSKVKGKGKMYSTGEKVRRNQIFDVKIKEGLDIEEDAVNRINAELINLYYPITGRMFDLNYMDSRRFVSGQS